jgi:cytochrome c oxidase subunit II
MNSTEDVIHDFFVPAFRIKADVVPGKYTNLWFEATKAGRYYLFCAEYCGMNHSGMIGSVVAMEPKDFDDWLSGNSSQQSPAVAGQQIYETLGCVSCHGPTGEGGRGPALAGVFGKQVFLTNGQSIKADEGYIRESILNPQAKLVSGFGPIMPTFQGQVSEEQVMQILAFIKSLQTQGPELAKPGGPMPAPSLAPAAATTPGTAK